LAERPLPEGVEGTAGNRPAKPGPGTPSPAVSGVGLSVQDLTRRMVERWQLPKTLQGVVISSVEPLSPADDAELRHGDVVIEINRQPVRTIVDYRRLTAAVRPGDVLALYIYEAESGQRVLRTVRIDTRQ